MWRRLKPSMPSCRKSERNPSFCKLEPDKKIEKLQKISDFLASDYSDYGPKTQRLWPATFANMPATFQRLSGVPGKILASPEKTAEKPQKWQKIGAKTEKWEKLPFFKRNRAQISCFPGAAVWPTRAGRDASFWLSCIGVAAGGKTRHGPLWNA